MRYYPYGTFENVASATFTDGADAPVKELEIAVTLVQSGEGDPSPDNVRAITGHTDCDLTIGSASGSADTKTYTVEFPEAAGTVYGGSLKYNGNGLWTLTVTHAGRDIGSITSMTYHQSGYFMITKATIVPAAKTGTSNAYVCSCFRQDTTGPDKDMYVYETSSQIRIVDSDYSDADAFRTAMTGQILVYPLAENVVYDNLETDEVMTLFQDNYITADTGNIIKLIYRINQLDYYRRFFMKNPGYILLDGGGIDLSTSDPQTITGSWDRTVTAIKTGKPIWAFNTKYGSGKPLTPVPVFAWYLSSTSAVIVGATLHIQVSNDDSCVVQDVAPQANRAFMQKIDGLIPEDDVDDEDPEEDPEEGDEK